jgi:hypothetical protein
MNRFLVFTLFCFSYTISNGQHDRHSKISIHVSPAMLNVSHLNPGYQLGMQARLSERWAVLSEVAFRLPFNNNTEFSNYKYVRIKSEVKKFITHKRTGSSKYISLEGSYATRSFDRTNDYYFLDREGSNDNTYYFDKAHIRTPLITLALKGGLESRLGDKAFLDVFAGVGIRNINTTYSQVENLTVQQGEESHGFFVSSNFAYRFNRSITKQHLTLGLRLHFIL